MTSMDTNSGGPGRTWMMIMGILMIILGVYCLANPFPASLSVQIMAAVGFFFGGIMSIMTAVNNKEDSGGTRFLNGLLGVVLIYLAITLIQHPLVGLISLTWMVAILILSMGIVRIFVAFGIRPTQGWAWILVSGIVSILLGVMVLTRLPEIAVAFLGILLGIELIMSGMSSVFLSFAMKSED